MNNATAIFVIVVGAFASVVAAIRIGIARAEKKWNDEIDAIRSRIKPSGIPKE